ncbi:hypothetical protein T08_14837, partial [Trichinella sp. T8]
MFDEGISEKSSVMQRTWTELMRFLLQKMKRKKTEATFEPEDPNLLPYCVVLCNRYRCCVVVTGANRLNGIVYGRLFSKCWISSSELAVRNALRALDAQYAEAHRAQVGLEDVLPDGESLEA